MVDVGTPDSHDALGAGEESRTAQLASRALRRLVDAGIDGAGPLHSAEEIVRRARESEADPEVAIVADHLKAAAAGGFVTGLGGVFTMPVALPVNVVEFYVLAARMAGSVASLRGYDVHTRATRTAVTLTLLGADADDILGRAGMSGGGRMARIALNRVPQAAAMVIRKGIGFRVVRSLGIRAAGRLTRAVPLAGGLIGAALDAYLMKRLADQVRSEFPHRSALDHRP